MTIFLYSCHIKLLITVIMNKYIFKVWKNGNNNKWYWNVKSAINGEIIAASSQGFASKQSAIRNAGLSGFTP